MTDRRRLLLPTLAAVLLGALALGVSACGSTSDQKTGLKEGEPVTLGDLQYNVVFSRFLNRHDVEDHQYLVGQPPPPPTAAYFGVFVQIANKSKQDPIAVPRQFRVIDTQHEVFKSIPSKSIYALALGNSIGPEDVAPALDSPAEVGPVNAALVLFLIPDAASENRPLQFVIPGIGGPATIDLDV